MEMHSGTCGEGGVMQPTRAVESKERQTGQRNEIYKENVDFLSSNYKLLNNTKLNSAIDCDF
jgi:hypothetical protein